MFFSAGTSSMLKKKWKMEFVSAENPSRKVVKYKKLSLAKLEEASKKLSTELNAL